MNRPFDLAICRAAARRGIVRAANRGDLAGPFVVHDANALDEVRIAQTHFDSGRETKIFLGRILTEIILLDPKLARKGNLTRAHRGIFGINDRL